MHLVQLKKLHQQVMDGINPTITEEDAHVMMNRVQEALDAKHLIIDLGSKVQILPMNNILQVEVSPPPVKLPPNCIKGASLV